MVSNLRTDMAYASDKLLNCGFVDEIFQSEPIGVPKFELVIIHQKSQKKKRLKCRLVDFAVLNKL